MLSTRGGNIGLVLLLSACCIIETLCLTYFKLVPLLAESNALVYVISSIAIVACALYFAYYAKPVNISEDKVWLLPQALLSVGMLVFLTVLYYNFGVQAYANGPVSHVDADMLPLIKKAGERFISGHDVYANPINEPGLWPGSYIPYLPAMWLPFVPATLLGIDIRWTLLAASLLGYIVMLPAIVRLPLKRATLAIPVLFTLFFILTKFYTWEDKQHFFTLTQEAVPGLIYLLLFVALMSRRVWFIAIMLALCTLSRYSVVLFIPVYVLWLLVDRDYKNLLRFLWVYGAVILCLFILPFFIKRPTYFLNLTAAYQTHAVKFWDLRINNEIPAGNLGLAYFIGYNVPLLQLLQPAMLTLSGLLFAAWLFLYYKFRSSIMQHKEIWVMAGFKLSLVLFYNFITMPFQYLFIVPTIVSYPLLLAVISKADSGKLKQV